MLINCDNKGCMKMVEAKLKVETGKVICPECGQVINNISESMKRTLKAFGQVVRDENKKSFMMACSNCKANREVVLDEDDNTVCNICKQPINVHAAMKQDILALGRRLEKKEDKPTTEKPKVKRGRPKKM